MSEFTVSRVKLIMEWLKSDLIEMSIWLTILSISMYAHAHTSKQAHKIGVN